MRQSLKAFVKEIPFICSMPAVLWQVLFMVAPVIIIIFYSVMSPGLIGTLDYYRALFKSSYALIIFRSIFLAIATACTTLLFAYPVAYFIAMRAKKYKNFMLFFLTLPFWVNFLVQIYAWYFLLEKNGLVSKILFSLGLTQEPILLSNSLFAVFVVMTYCYLPFMIMPLYNILDKIDARLLDASYDLGATTWQTFYRITLPLSLPGVKTGLLLVMIPAFGEFVIPALLGGGKNMLVGTLISYFFLVARNNGHGSAFTCLSAFVLVLTLLFFYGLSRIWFISKTMRGR